MTISIKSSRDIVGFCIEVEVNAEGEEAISAVVINLDNFQIGSDYLTPPEIQYERVITQAGGYTPGTEHTITVTATTDKGKQRTASKKWRD